MGFEIVIDADMGRVLNGTSNTSALRKEVEKQVPMHRVSTYLQSTSMIGITILR